MEEKLAKLQSIDSLKMVLGFGVIIITLFLMSLLSKAIDKLMYRYCQKWKESTRLWVKTCTLLAVLIGAVALVLVLMGKDGTSALLLLLLVMGIAVYAASSRITNLSNGVGIVLKKYYEPGDYIITDGIEGIVVHTSFYETKIQSIKRETIYVPNTAIAVNSLKVLHQEDPYFIPFVLCADSSTAPDQVETIFKEAAKEEAKVLQDMNTTFSVSGMYDDRVEYTCGVFCKFKDRFDAESNVRTLMLEKFKKNDIFLSSSDRYFNFRMNQMAK